MTQTKILDGNFLSEILQKDIRRRVEELKIKSGKVPGLGVILVGDNPASRSYVARKEKVAQEKCGFYTADQFLPESASMADVTAAIEKFNHDPKINGILLQLPVPRHLNANILIDRILPEKDADCLHPVNQGLMLRGDGKLRPCTPLGAMALIDFAMSPYNSAQVALDYNEIKEADLSGKNVVVIGRSILVGKPLVSLLLERNATVTQAHSKTKNIWEVTSRADILIAAVGVPKLVKASWVKDGAIVIDVGINRTADGKLVGDVDYDDVALKTSAITPVPGGVGPMTVAMLMQNTLNACG